VTLVDFLMPIMDGLDCMQQYRDWEKYHRPWMNQRLVGISAHATQEDVEKGLKIGMDDYRAKPITFKVLSGLIECDEQMNMSRRLDEIERRDDLIKNGGNDDGTKVKPKVAHVIDGRACTLLIISPKSEEEHTKLLQKVVKNSGWQTTTASTEGEALVWLKMRTWDLVLVDETFAPLICDFREWEFKKRQNLQERMTLMVENIEEVRVAHDGPPKNLDALAGKPMGVNAVSNLLESTYLHLRQRSGK
jgi:CheY-like chemotaxis protein